MLARRERIERLLGVPVIWSRDTDRINRRIGQQLAIIGDLFRLMPGPSFYSLSRFVTMPIEHVANRDDLHLPLLLKLDRRFQVRLGAPTDADEAEP